MTKAEAENDVVEVRLMRLQDGFVLAHAAAQFMSSVLSFQPDAGD